MIRLFLLFSIFIQVFGATGEEKKYKFAVCALFHNEADYLEEWLEYHRMIGVDHFYLYDNGSTDRYLKVLRPYLNQKLVTLMKWPDRASKENPSHWALSTQVPAFENAIQLYAKDEAKWLIFLDINEFLLPVHEDSLNQLLSKHKKVPALEISVDCFDASQEQIPTLEKKYVIESEDLTKEPQSDVRKSVKKIIFHPEEYRGSTWAPYVCQFKEGQKPRVIGPEHIKINRYVGRNTIRKKPKRKVYVEKSESSAREIKDIVDSGYDHEDPKKSIHRFLPGLSHKLGK